SPWRAWRRSPPPGLSGALNLSGRGLDELPEGLCAAVGSSLSVLSLRRNRLAHLPSAAALRHLGRLAELDLSHNRLRCLRDDGQALALLRGLRKLNLSHNQLGGEETLPSGLGELPQLEELDLSFNRLS
uniref:Uncharacterized protein n=1 Tax=Naja naja TaxID=35670 RepID=A0A8C6XUS2_NAJNA